MLLLIVGLFFYFERFNKIRSLKYKYYSVTSKQFSCMMLFGDYHFDKLLYNAQEPDDDKKWYQNLNDDQVDKFNLSINSRQKIKSNYWSKMHDKPGHAIQDEVSRVFEKELEKFYGLNEETEEAWKQTQGYQSFIRAIRKFPEEQQEIIIAEVVKNQFGDGEGTAPREQFKIVFCTFGFKNNPQLIQLQTRSASLANLICAESAQVSGQNILDDDGMQHSEQNNS